MSDAVEVNFDGLIGPTHHYGGLAYGNVASQAHRHQISNPQAAALEGLAKMKQLADLGVKQAVLLPHERPNVALLRQLGFAGDDAAVLARAGRADVSLLSAACSASNMWTANAATVSPSADAADGRVHLTPANLISNLHRAGEAAFTGTMLRRIFRDEATFAHHPPLPAAMQFADEGAANHMRLCAAHHQGGVEVFVYGKGYDAAAAPRRYPARQSLAASRAVARLHQLDEDATLFVQQHPDAIDAGVFHNDVIAVGNEHVLLCHERAFADQTAVLDDLQKRFAVRCGEALQIIEVRENEVPLNDAVASYLFNGQIVTLPAGGMALIYPAECDEIASTRAFVDKLRQMETPIAAMHCVNLRQSMHNGGGPACLRLRVVLTPRQLQAVHSGIIFTASLYDRLVAWVRKHYRTALTLDDLADIALLHESRAALNELTAIVGLEGLYAFQR